MSFNNVDALAEAYDAVFALFDRLRECAAVDRRDGPVVASGAITKIVLL